VGGSGQADLLQVDQHQGDVPVLLEVLLEVMDLLGCREDDGDAAGVVVGTGTVPDGVQVSQDDQGRPGDGPAVGGHDVDPGHPSPDPQWPQVPQWVAGV